MKKLLALAITLCMTLGTTTAVFAQGGFDEYGYNYQANIFNGYYDNYGRPDVPVGSGDKLQMKWNDAWLNEDKVRHEGFNSYIGSGAWLTNHIWGEYEEDGVTYEWDYFIKIVAAGETDYKDGTNWYHEDGTLLGYILWGDFAVVQEIYNDEGTGEQGLTYSTPSPGLGL